MSIHAQSEHIKMWFTAQELADASNEGQFPDLPTTKDGIVKRANAENWARYHSLVRAEKARGGTITRYHIELLPLHVRLGYIARFLTVEPGDLRVASEGAGDLTERARLTRDAKVCILRLADRFHRTSGLTQKGSDGMFADVFNRGLPGLPEWVSAVVGAISIRTLSRWRAAEKEAGTGALAHDPAMARKGSGLLETANDGRVQSHILGWIAKSPSLSAAVIRGYVEDKFGAELVDRNGEMKPLPPVRTFQHFIAALKEAEKMPLLAITNPDKFRSNGKLRGTGAYRWVKDPNQLWMIDASPVDAMCVDGRHSIYACVDIATRRVVISLSRTPRASAVGLMIRKATLRWGVAHMIKTDNGSDFVAVATKRLFDDLDITPDVSRAYSPAEKGHIERLIGTFQREVCPQLPGYIGHNVADRKAIEERKTFAQRLGQDDKDLFEVSLTAEQLQQHIDDWVEHVYHEREHHGLGKETPNAVAARSAEPIRRVDERALDALLMPVAGKDGLRVMGPQGIWIDNFPYLCGTIMVGTKVFVRQDPIDMGKVYVYTADGRQFLDEAICAELSDINRTDFVKAKIEENNRLMAEKLREMKAEIRDINKGPSGIERTIRLAKRKAAERAGASANVIQLPKRETQHTTPRIAAALDAVTLPKGPNQPKPLNERAQMIHEAIVREAELKATSKVVHLDPDAALPASARRYKWALALEEQIRKGVAPDDATAGQLARFQASATYQTIRDIHKDFGLEQALISAPR